MSAQSNFSLTAVLSPESRAAVLIEALPYIRRFADKVVVVKYGGNALAGASEADALALFAWLLPRKAQAACITRG